MFQESNKDADASTEFGGTSSFDRLPHLQPGFGRLRHVLFGSPSAVDQTIKLLHRLDYAEPNDWSKPMPTGEPDEVMSVLTRRVRE